LSHVDLYNDKAARVKHNRRQEKRIKELRDSSQTLTDEEHSMSPSRAGWYIRTVAGGTAAVFEIKERNCGSDLNKIGRSSTRHPGG
jgi:hypothetical protein